MAAPPWRQWTNALCLPHPADDESAAACHDRPMIRAHLVAGLFGLLPLLAASPALAVDRAASDHPAASLVREAIRTSRGNPDDARRLADDALARLAVRPDADLEIRARLALCDYYSERDLERARDMLARATAQLPLARRGGLRAGVHSCEGEIHEAAGDTTRALSAFELAVSTAEAASDEEMLANALYLRGWLRGVQGDFALGLLDLRRSVTLYEKTDNPEHSRTAVNGIASIYNRMGDYAQAQQYFEQAAKAQLAAGMQREAMVTMYNLGRTREHLGLWDDARATYLQAMGLARSIGYSRGEAYVHRGLASVHNARGEWRQALERLADAEQLAAGTPDARLQAQLALVRGVALRGLKRPAESIAVLNGALAAFAKAEAPAEVAATRAALAAAQADLGDWRAAFENQRLLKEVTDRLHARQLDQRFLTLKVEFDTAAREKENALLLREQAVTVAALEQQRHAGQLQIVAVTLAALLAAVLGLLAWRHRRISRTMHNLAMTDELTGLPNRRAVLARLGQLLATGNDCAVLILDIDHFKAINDQHGHLVGDDVLRAVAGRVAAVLRGPMVGGRLGGEEFLLLLPDMDLDEAVEVGEEVRTAVVQIDTSRWFSGRPLSVSAGVAIAHPGPGGVADALRRADEALYEAKAAGRNRVHFGRLVLASSS
jgi:diguanylate cyclase (GGDEF)-like protein